MKSLKSLSGRIKSAAGSLSHIDAQIDDLKMNQGLLLSLLNQNRQSTRLQDYEFKIFSQWGEDGILQHLTKSVDIRHKTFIEFGVETFTEANCRFLLMKDNWSGLVIDGSSSNIAKLRKSDMFWRFQLEAVHSFITRENIDELISRSGFDEDLGILSIDIDGNDYFVLDAIQSFRPRILICEYNSVFGVRKISVPYTADFHRTKQHFSNLYFGASLTAISHLAGKKGYSLVGTNTVGCNAFFVRNDLVNNKLEVLTPEQAYSPSKFRESRDEEGNLTYLGGDERLEAIRGLPVLNVETQVIEKL